MTAFVLFVIAGVVALPVWALVGDRTARLVASLSVAAAVGCAAIARVSGETLPGDQAAAAVILGVLLCISGGGLAVTAVFEHLDALPSTPDAGAGPRPVSMARAGEVLRGGAWIGALERLAVFGCLLADQPDGVAVVLAIKGLGRYPELRAAAEAGGGRATLSAVAERFIIGTLVSFLWAALCAYVVGP